MAVLVRRENFMIKGKFFWVLVIGIIVLSSGSLISGMILQEVTRNDYIVFAVSSGIFGARQIQKLESPNHGSNIATLHKTNGLGDLNFIVKLNSAEIYHSPDYPAFPDHLYRETLMWDKTGEVLVFELMGKRVFAFNTVTKKQLEKGELSKFILFPLTTENKINVQLKDIDD